MAENSAISWTTHTFNPWWGCTKVGPGCEFCYAEVLDARFAGEDGERHWGVGVPRRLIKNWRGPEKWHREFEEYGGERPWVFCASMADVFDKEVPAAWRARLWDLVRDTYHLRWIFVTKRIGNAAKMLPHDWRESFGHCGLVATVCDQNEANRDIPTLRAMPARWRGISIEPCLGPIDFAHGILLNDIDWVICGGESGPRARRMRLTWARQIRDQTLRAGKSFHFKQWGEFLSRDDPAAAGEAWERVGKREAGRALDGVIHDGMPPTDEAWHNG